MRCLFSGRGLQSVSTLAVGPPTLRRRVMEAFGAIVVVVGNDSLAST